MSLNSQSVSVKTIAKEACLYLVANLSEKQSPTSEDTQAITVSRRIFDGWSRNQATAILTSLVEALQEELKTNHEMEKLEVTELLPALKWISGANTDWRPHIESFSEVLLSAGPSSSTPSSASKTAEPEEVPISGKTADASSSTAQQG